MLTDLYMERDQDGGNKKRELIQTQALDDKRVDQDFVVRKALRITSRMVMSGVSCAHDSSPDALVNFDGIGGRTRGGPSSLPFPSLPARRTTQAGKEEAEEAWC